ncbi:hypothetical protein J1605_012707 [Eschrichtius robustus]|uniref:AMP-dependent synthetase/ligase domain-containing protein n=1 Tax=Eschrichtius robustus TaxID=9764 RepID=A0AB34GKK3_ESCRO|nr:hypothetical protein J1605_012707 [Eschrichtius robustus]
MQPSRWLLEDFAFCVNSDDSFLPLEGVLDRFSQIQPKLIFSVEAVVYNGKEHDHIDKLQQVVKGLADLKKVVVIPYVSSREKIDISKIPNSVFLEDFLATGQGAQAPQLEFEQLPFSHPLFIMFSSGTTGAPKCMVHSAGGTLIQHLKEHVLHGNMTSGDIILYYTTVIAGSAARAAGSVHQTPGCVRETPGCVRETPGSVRQTPGRVRRTPGRVPEQPLLRDPSLLLSFSPSQRLPT